MGAPTEYDPAALGAEVVRACRALGFALAGIARAAPSSRGAEFRSWLAAGKHGSMDWMTELIEERLDPGAMLAGARSIIMVADQYAAPRDSCSQGAEPGTPADGAPAQGRIARYAQGRDYHAVMKRRLHTLADRLRARCPGHEFRSFVDTGPVLEREHAARAGLGWIGRHTLLIHPRLGSYLLLGGIATTLDIRAPQHQPPPLADHCGACTRCIDACPTGAITPYQVDARKCISYLTIEHSGELSDNLRPAIGDWLFGCDVCQEVCPYNSGRAASGPAEERVHPAYQGRRASLPAAEVAGWTDEAYRQATSGTALKRASLEMFRRNAAMVERNAISREKSTEIRASPGDARSDVKGTGAGEGAVGAS